MEEEDKHILVVLALFMGIKHVMSLYWHFNKFDLSFLFATLHNFWLHLFTQIYRQHCPSTENLIPTLHIHLHLLLQLPLL